MIKFRAFLTIILAGCAALSILAQEPCANTTCMDNVPCTTVNEEPAPCYAPVDGCNYNYCDEPTLVDRYAYLAHKYNTYGPAERAAAITDNNTEVIELNNLDNHFAQNNIGQSLTTDQLLKLQAAQGSVRR